MALTSEQYRTLTALSNTVKDPILKKDLQRLTEEYKPTPSFKAQFEALPDGAVVETINALGDTQITVRRRLDQQDARTLYYSGNRENMRGQVINGWGCTNLVWENIKEMHVLVRESDKPKHKNSLDDFEQFECGGREWLVLENRADYDWWANNVRTNIHNDVVSLHPHDEYCLYTYVREAEMDDGNLTYTYPLYASKDGRDASVNDAFRRKFDLD